GWAPCRARPLRGSPAMAPAVRAPACWSRRGSPEREIGEAALGNVLAQSLHQIGVIGQIVRRQQHARQDLARFSEMVEIGAAEDGATRAAALRVERGRVFGMAGIA